jgi:hypothetical protein
MPIDRQRHSTELLHKLEPNRQQRQRSKLSSLSLVLSALRVVVFAPERKTVISRSKWTEAALCVHYANFTPEDNHSQNLIALCTPLSSSTALNCQVQKCLAGSSEAIALVSSSKNFFGKVILTPVRGREPVIVRNTLKIRKQQKST